MKVSHIPKEKQNASIEPIGRGGFDCTPQPLLTSPTGAQEVTPWGTVVALQAGWTVNRMLVFHSSPLVSGPAHRLTDGQSWQGRHHPAVSAANNIAKFSRFHRLTVDHPKRTQSTEPGNYLQ
jgi:hypothetical protein